jgi:sarcosine oxidase subunit beta
MIDSAKSPLPAHVEIVIMGGGVAGCSAALHLAKLGHKVVLFERRLCGGMASGQNYGGVRQQGRLESELPLSFRSRELWGRMAQIVGHDCGFLATGHLKLARTPEQLASLEDWAVMARRHGLEVTLVGGNELHQQHPYLSQEVCGASFCPSDGSANPRVTGPLWARAAEAAGADLREYSPVQALEHEGGGFRVTLADGRAIGCDVLINTAGAWGAELAAQLGEAYPEGTLHPNMNVSEPVAPVLAANFGVCGGDVYFRQTGRGNIIFGGGNGIGDRDRLWSRPLAEVNARQAVAMLRLVPALAGINLLRSWSGIDGMMPDEQPVFGPSPTVPGLFHAFGFSGHGFQLGPGAGAVLCDLVTKGESPTDISVLAPKRFL